MALQFALLVLLTLATLSLARRPPDVVLVAPDGKSTYVNASIAEEALVRFLQEQRQRPSDVTISHFSRDFINSFMAINSDTIDAEWMHSLSMMTPDLRSRMLKEAASQKFLERFRLTQVKTDISLRELTLVEKLETAVHVHATLLRHKTVAGGAEASDALSVDLIEKVVPRSFDYPDGLAIAEFRNNAAEPMQSATPNSAP